MLERPRTALVVIVVASTLVRFAAALLLRTPLYFPDEYLYESLARGLAHGHVFEIRGHDATLSQTASYLVPAIMAPVWLVHDVDVSYRLTQLLGSLVFSLAAIPVYALARRAGVGVRSGLLAAALSLAVPAGLFTGMVVAEPYAYTSLLSVLLLAVKCVDRYSRPRAAATAVAAVALILVGGLQFALVPPVMLVGSLVVVDRLRRTRIIATLLVFAAVGAFAAWFSVHDVLTEVVA